MKLGIEMCDKKIPRMNCFFFLLKRFKKIKIVFRNPVMASFFFFTSHLVSSVYCYASTNLQKEKWWIHKTVFQTFKNVLLWRFIILTFCWLCRFPHPWRRFVFTLWCVHFQGFYSFSRCGFFLRHVLFCLCRFDFLIDCFWPCGFRLCTGPLQSKNIGVRFYK